MSDLIERQAAIDAVEESRRLNHHQDGKAACAHEYEHRHFLKLLRDLPPAQPERKTGWWLIREGISDAQCSECKMYFKDVYDIDNSDAFCRHCGAKMKGLKVVKHG